MPVLWGRPSLSLVDQLHGGERQLVGIEACPGVATGAVDRGLQVDLADALEHADEAGTDGDQSAGVRRLDVARGTLG